LRTRVEASRKVRGDSAERNLVLSIFPYIKRNILLQRTAQSVSVCITVRSRDFSIERTPNFRKSLVPHCFTQYGRRRDYFESPFDEQSPVQCAGVSLWRLGRSIICNSVQTSLTHVSFVLVVIARQNVTDLMQKHKIPKSKCDKTLAKLASGENAPVVLKEFGTWSLPDERSSFEHCLVLVRFLFSLFLLFSLPAPWIRATPRGLL
jgi:hypothetical protein